MTGGTGAWKWQQAVVSLVMNVVDVFISVRSGNDDQSGRRGVWCDQSSDWLW